MIEPVSQELPEVLSTAGLIVLRSYAVNLPDQYIDQLITKSRQPHVLEYEKHEDAEGRFKDRDLFKKWAEKKRLVYLLVDKNNDEVAGIIWFGESVNPLIDSKYGVTFGIRLYEGYVGRGLSKPLMKVGHLDARKYFSSKWVWLDYTEGNIAAERAYASFGYQELGRDSGRVVMGKEL